MTNDSTSSDEVFERKRERRRELAALSIEEKVFMLIELQRLANQVAVASGRPCMKPWGEERDA